MQQGIRRTVVIATAISGLVWFAVWGGIHGWFPELQRVLLLELVNRAGPWQVEVARIGGSLVDGFTLEDASLRARGDASPADVMTAERIQLHVDLSQAYEQRHVIVQNLGVEGLRIHLEQAEAAQWRLEDLSRPSDPLPEAPDARPWQVSIDDLQIRVSELSGRWRDPRTAGSIVVRGTLVAQDIVWPGPEGHGGWSHLTMDLRLVRGEIGPLRLGSGRLRFSGPPQHLDLRLERASATAGDRGSFYLTASVALDETRSAAGLDAVKARLSFSDLDLAGVSLQQGGSRLPATRLNGQLKFGQRETGFGLDLSLDPGEIEGVAIESARAHVDFAPETGIWRLTQSEITSHEATLRAHGRGSLDQIETLAVEASAVPVAPFARALGIASEIVGNVDLAAQLSGPPADPHGRLTLDGAIGIDERPRLALAVDLDLAGDGVYLLRQIDLATDAGSDFALSSTAPARLVRENGSWRLDDLDLVGVSGALAIHRLQSDGTTHQVHARFDALDLGALTRFALPDRMLDGKLSGPLHFDNRGPHATLTSDLVLEAPRYEGFAVDRIRLASRSGDGLLSFASQLEWDEAQPIEINLVLPFSVIDGGVVAMATHPETRVSLRAEQIPAQRIETWLPEVADVAGLLDGHVTGSFELEGSKAGPLVSGEASWQNARFGTARAEQVALACRTEDGTLQLDLGISHESRSELSADAAIDLGRFIRHPADLLSDPHHHASVHADDVDLGWLLPRSSARRLGRVEAVLGRASGRLDIRGDEAGPRINGQLAIGDGEVQLALVDQPFGPIAASLVFDNDALRVEHITIGSTKGTVSVRGHYRWASLSAPDEVDFHAHFKKFALTHFPLLDARVDGDIHLTGELAALDARGDLAFRRVQINLPAPEDPLFREVRILGLEEADPIESIASSGRPPSAYQTMRTQIALDIRKGAKIRERGADLQAEGQILLRKRRLSPTVLQGSLQTTGGTYTFLGRTFDVRQGIATFEERIPPDPEMRIVATRQIGDVTVGVRRTGTWSNPSARLFSEPEMDKTEILSYLVFNKPRNEIGSDDDARLNAAAAQLAGNLALAQISRVLSEELPINEISMQVSEDMSLASVGVETNVGEDIIVRYDRALQDGAGDRLTVEWRFWKDFSLRSEYADGGTSGLDLFWSYEY